MGTSSTHYHWDWQKILIAIHQNIQSRSLLNSSEPHQIVRLSTKLAIGFGERSANKITRAGAGGRGKCNDKNVDKNQVENIEKTNKTYCNNHYDFHRNCWRNQYNNNYLSLDNVKQSKGTLEIPKNQKKTPEHLK